MAQVQQGLEGREAREVEDREEEHEEEEEAQTTSPAPYFVKEALYYAFYGKDARKMIARDNRPGEGTR